MVFAHDTEASLAFTTALVNTGASASRSRGDELTSLPALDLLLDQHEYSGRRDGDTAELDAVRSLRPEFRAYWEVDRDSAATLVNGVLRTCDALPQLVRHGHWDWHLHATDPDVALVTRMRVETALAMVDVVRSNEFDRLRVCAADDCAAVLVDLSRNRSKRYCDVGNCGNRMNVHAYRARHATAPLSTARSEKR